MCIHDGVDHSTRANMLVRQLVDEHDPKYGVGSMTCSVYDTAWVAMIAKTVNGETEWLFPSSFHYLLNTQQHDGGWQTSSSDIDGILNTLAALLALTKHVDTSIQTNKDTLEGLRHRKLRAIYYLEAKFSKWDVSVRDHIRFTLLLPKLLQLLEHEGIEFSFFGKDMLMDLKQKKAANFEPSTLYSKIRNPAAHCLEGLIGEIDFDRVSQQKISGSMMASPASTAAYLMNCSRWDDEAEAYLGHIVGLADGERTGGVPSKYPTTVFEVTSVLSVLLENGISASDLDTPRLENAVGLLEDCLLLEHGVTGFAPYVESDADNTAKTISALCRLGKSPSPLGLIVRYETREFFKTYTQDRNPSFRTNCHVLKALLDLLPGNREQMPQIDKVIRFITNCWWTSNGQMEDPSNSSPNYPVMLMVNAFVRSVDLWEQGLCPVLDDLLLRDKVIICIFQALTRTLQAQNYNGSWGIGQRCESTAYGVLILTKAASFACASRIKLQLAEALGKSQTFLSKAFRPLGEADHVWTGKTTSGSYFLHQAYVLAALQATVSKSKAHPGQPDESRFIVPLAKVTIQTKYYSRQPWFANIPGWQIQACLIESYLLLPQLNDIRYAVFPTDSLKEDKYFESVPFTWIAASALEGRHIGPEYLYQLMIVTFLNRQLEDYVQNVIGEVFAGCLFEIEDIIYGIFEEIELYTPRDQCFCDSHGGPTSRNSISTSATTSLSEARAILYRFISHILNHPYVLMASHHDQNQLRTELLAFLLGRVNQLSERNSSAPEGRDVSENVPAQSLKQSESSTTTDQTCHPYIFAFLSCLVGNQIPNGGVGKRRDFLGSPEQQYIASDLCRHLCVISLMSSNTIERPSSPTAGTRPDNARPRATSFSSGRQSFNGSISSASTASSSYSDASSPISPVSSNSSVPGDSPNSVTFPKLLFEHTARASIQPSQQTLQLIRLLDHERRSIKLCLESLMEAGTDQCTANVVKLFVAVSELSEQIYSDPNIGPYSHPRATCSSTDSACILNTPPIPQQNSARRGSVAAARAALSIEPLAPRQHSRSVSLANSIASVAVSFTTGDDQNFMMAPTMPPSIPLPTLPANKTTPILTTTATPRSRREWNGNKATQHPNTPPRRAAHVANTNHEIERIERTMANLDADDTPTLVPNEPAQPQQQQRRATTSAGTLSRKTLSQPDVPNTPKRIPASPTSPTNMDPDSLKLEKARIQTQRRMSYEISRKTASDLQAKAMLEAQTEYVRAKELQVKAKMVRERERERERERGEEWVRRKTMAGDGAEGEEARKLQRLQRLSRIGIGGPRWKAPF